MTADSVNGATSVDTQAQSQVTNGFAQAQDSTMVSGLPVAGNAPISADEIALYDRQIRLWGVKAQELIRGANILLIGMKALGNEIAKNLVLAGIGSLTIIDHEVVTEDDLCSQFLVTEEDIGKNRAEAAGVQLKKMNPRVNLLTDIDPLLSKMPEYFSVYDITIATNLPFDLAANINLSCRMYNRKFYAADTHGMYGYIFSDLIMHNFIVEKERANIATKPMTAETSTRTVVDVATKRDNDKIIEMVTKQETYSMFMLANSSPLPPDVSKNRRTKLRVTPLLTCLRALFDFQKESGGRLPGHTPADLITFTRFANERHLELQLPIETLRAEFLRIFIQNLGSELSPVAAFLGGRLAQDVINVLGQREHPLQNFLLFDGEEFKAPIYSLHPVNDPSVTAQMNGNSVAVEIPPADMVMNGAILV